MPCQSYRDALIEIAASGAEPQADLRAHLGSCSDCQAAFEQERALFFSIDAGLHSVSNAEVPASLLPRVRAGLDEVASDKRAWNFRWVALGTAAVAVAGIFAANSLWHRRVTPSPVEAVQGATRPLVEPPPTANPPVAPRVSTKASPHLAEHWKSAHAVTAKASTPANAAPEVLVSQEERVVLAEYAERWRRHKATIVLAQNFETTVSPLRVAPIQIEDLDVKLLAEDKAQ
jgi:hypothetical protein